MVKPSGNVTIPWANITSKGHGPGSTDYVGNITLILNPELCTLETCDLTLANFMYLPTVPGNAIFAGLFGLFIIVQLFLGIKHKIWGFMSALCLGLLLECVGYIARILIHNNPFESNFFLIYLVLLTIAPAFLTAGYDLSDLFQDAMTNYSHSIYLCLARIIVVYGEHLSRFKPRTYTMVFVTCDIICLVLQGLGGGIASSADTKESSDLGKNIMMAGLIFQVVSLGLFGICCGEFAFRVLKGKGSRNPRYTAITSSLLFKSFLVGKFQFPN
jgi:hypothetical protein